MAYKIDTVKCVGCGACAGGGVCPGGAITIKDGKAVIDPAKCFSCGACASMCPMAAILT